MNQDSVVSVSSSRSSSSPKIKGILLDIDNTLYQYDPLHQHAMQTVWQWVEAKIPIELDQFKLAFKRARQQIHQELAEQAASHNRLLYFERCCELCGLNPLRYAHALYTEYWDDFIAHLILEASALKYLQANQLPICLLTDLTADIQYRKIQKLGLADFCQHVITSEAAGIEKPHPYMFLSALQTLALQPSEVLMIGDNLNKDILGAHQLGITALWLNRDQQNVQLPEHCHRISSLAEVFAFYE